MPHSTRGLVIEPAGYSTRSVRSSGRLCTKAFPWGGPVSTARRFHSVVSDQMESRAIQLRGKISRVPPRTLRDSPTNLPTTWTRSIEPRPIQQTAYDRTRCRDPVKRDPLMPYRADRTT